MRLIGLIVLWWFGCVLLGMVINMVRAKANPGQAINDWFSGFLIGLAIGPIGLLPPWDEKTIGGAVGTTLFGYLYLHS